MPAEMDALLVVANCSKPTVAQISGFAVGGAVALALPCDFRIADDSASLFIPAGRLGVVYNRLECELLLRQVGAARQQGWPVALPRLECSRALTRCLT